MVSHQLSTSTCSLNLHGLIQVQVHKSCTPVAQHVFHQLQSISLHSVCLFRTPSYPYLLSLRANYCGILWLRKLWKCREHWLTNISTRFPSCEILIDDGDSLIRIKVASHADSYVIGTIPLIEVVLDICDRRILKVLLRTQRGLKSIRMIREEHLTTCSKEFSGVSGKTDVILLVNSLELCVETTYNHILETISLNLSPVLNLVRRDIFCVASYIIRGVSISTISAYCCHQFVVLIGDEVLGSHLRY